MCTDWLWSQTATRSAPFPPPPPRRHPRARPGGRTRWLGTGGRRCPGSGTGSISSSRCQPPLWKQRANVVHPSLYWTNWFATLNYPWNSWAYGSLFLHIFMIIFRSSSIHSSWRKTRSYMSLPLVKWSAMASIRSLRLGLLNHGMYPMPQQFRVRAFNLRLE